MYFSREDSQEAGVEMPAGVRWAVLVGLVLIAWLTLAPGSVYGLI
jgi:hypothetical protein